MDTSDCFLIKGLALNVIGIYPNPASTDLNISFSTNEEAKIHFVIFDMLGKTLMQWEAAIVDGGYVQVVSIVGLSQGIYFLSAKIGERVMTEKFVKE